MTLKVFTIALSACLPLLAANDATLPAHRDGAVLLAFRPNVPFAVENSILASVGAHVVKRLGANSLLVNIPSGAVAAAIQFLKARPEVLYSEPDFATLPGDSIQTHPLGGSSMAGPRTASVPQGAVFPNDSFAVNQWALLNTGQTVNGFMGTPGADERAATAWGITTGTNTVVVAVLDSGVQYSHPDLATNIWNNPGGIGGCAAGTHGYNVLTSTCDPMDDDTCFGGHGTHIAGIIGAVGNNAAGVVGVNWTTTILPVKWINSNCGGYTSDLITAMDWVIQARQAGVNIRVANDSGTWPGTAFSQALSDEIDLLGANDILFVTAAGNSSQNNDTVPRYPCSYARPTEICTAATDENDNLWGNSDYGSGVVQMAAPGVDIFSTMRVSNYGFISGCSMSAGEVSGAAALILSRGYLPVASLRSTILASVDPLPSLTNRVATGGRLNVCKAVPGCSGASTSAPFNTALPQISGVPQSGALLAASTGMWSGIPTTFAYQWYRCSSSGSNCSAITGATSQTYAVLARADTGATLAVLVTASNTSGSALAQSSPSGVIASAASPFNIASTIVDGQTIGGALSWQATPARAVSFMQFYVDGVLSQTDPASPYIYNQGSTNSFDTTSLPNGPHVLGLRALATDTRTYGFYSANVTVANPPQNTALPGITGSAVQGQTLSASTGLWTNSPSGYAYRWNRCNTSGTGCAAISGATSNSYTVAAADVGSTLRVAVTASNAAGSNTATSPQTATVAGAVRVATTVLPGGRNGSPYSATLAASGGLTPYTWSISSGALPPGLNLASATGTISGTPSTTGTSNFTVQVADSNAQTAIKALSIAIAPAGTGIALVQSSSAQGSAVPSLSVPFPAGNTAGNLIVAFVRMSSSGQTVNVTDSAGNVYTDAVSQVQSADGHQTHLYYAKNIAGSANTVTASFSSINNHPWLAIYEYGGLSATNPLGRTAAAQGGDASPNTGAPVLTNNPNELIFAGVGFPYSYGGAVTAGAPYSIAQQNTGTSRSANETAIVSATGSYTAAFSLSAPAQWSAVLATFAAAPSGPTPPTITTASLPPAQAGSPYSTTLAASGGIQPYTWSISLGTLPAGLALAASTGVISGTPTTTGTSNFTVQVTDGNAQAATKALSIVVSAAGAPIALLQSNAGENSAVPSIAVPFPSANTAGNLIVAFVRMSSTGQTVTVTDSAGNVYADAVSQVQSSDGHQIHVFYARNIVGGINTVTASFSSTNNHPWLAVYEYSGLSATSPLDRTAAAQGSDASPNSGASVVTAAANELIFAAVGFPNSYGGAVSAGAGYTLAQQDLGTSRAANETAVVSAAGSYSATFALTVPANWTAVLATFKP